MLELRPIAITIYMSAFGTLNMFAQPACSPTTTNGTCPTATALTVGNPCVNGTTCGGGAQAASTCLFAGSQCSWYTFTATSANMFVYIPVTATDGCHISSNVYRSTGPCIGTEVSCLSGAPLDDVHTLTGLTVGALYYVQVCYSPGGPCGNNGSAEYCIEVGNSAAPCNTCSTPCGAALGYPTTPTIAQVVADCTTDPYFPPLQPGTAHTFCNTFTATATTVSFNVIITSNCGAGNVTAFSWQLFNSPSCGGAIQSGTLTSLNFTGLTIGNDYVYCYTFTVPSTCTHSQHCPYFVGATTLPVTWLGLNARVVDDTWVDLDWSTASERNNDHFTVQRSRTAVDFEAIGTVPGAGDSQTLITYRFKDPNPYPGLSYYRIEQTDLDGTRHQHQPVPVFVNRLLADVVLFPNPVTGEGTLSFHSTQDTEVTVRIVDVFGQVVRERRMTAQEGANRLHLGMGSAAQGVYLLNLTADHEQFAIRFIKH